MSLNINLFSGGIKVQIGPAVLYVARTGNHNYNRRLAELHVQHAERLAQIQQGESEGKPLTLADQLFLNDLAVQAAVGTVLVGWDESSLDLDGKPLVFNHANAELLLRIPEISAVVFDAASQLAKQAAALLKTDAK